MPDDLSEAARMAGVAALTGGAARVLVALHGGVRRWQVLLQEAGLGAMLGIMAAGAVGTRVMDIVVAAVERKVG